MPRLMYDSVDPSVIPVDAAMVAGYCNGSYKWSDAAWSRFPNAVHVRINVTGNVGEGGDVLDIEAGDATPAQAPIWFDGRVKAGAKQLAVYCNRSTLAAVNAAMGGRSFFRWIATLDGTLHIAGHRPMIGPAAVQFANAAMVGANVDLSIVWEDGWMPSPDEPEPVPPPPAWEATAKTEADALAALLDKNAA